jgi:hypothetical protein
VRLHRGEHPQPAAVRAVLAAIASGEGGGCGEEAAAEITHTIIRRSAMKPSKRARRRARGRAIAIRPPYSAAALALGHDRAVAIARAGGFQAYRRKWAFLFTDEIDCFDCGLSQEDARDELQRIERSL